MSEDDISLDEKRMYGERRGQTTAFVASALGIARVELAGDQVGRFSLVHRCTARSVAATREIVVAGTDEDVLISRDDGFVETGFGPATAVGVYEETVLAASPDGYIARYEDNWETAGEVSDPRRFDAGLLATGDGVVRVGSTLEPLGLDDVNDVANDGPFAATDRGLFHYDGEWTRESDCEVTAVTAADNRVYAIGENGLLKRDTGAWQSLVVPDDPILVDVAHGESLYAVTGDGTIFVYADPERTPDGRGGWGSRALGLSGVVELAVC